MIYDLHHGVHRASLWIIRAVDQAFDAGMYHSAGAHGTRLNCNKEIAISQAMVTNRRTCVSQRNHFRVSGGIAIGDVAVPAAADDVSIAYNDCAYGNLVHFQGALGAAEGLFHPEFVRTVVGCWSLVVGHAEVNLFYGNGKGRIVIDGQRLTTEVTGEHGEQRSREAIGRVILAALWACPAYCARCSLLIYYKD